MELDTNNISEEDTNPSQSSYYDTLLESAIALRKINECREAARLIQKAIKQDKNNPRAYTIAGLIYEDLGDLNKAEVNLRKAVSIDSSYDEALKTLGLFLVKHEKQVEGIDILCQYIQAENWDQINILETIYNFGPKLSRLSNDEKRSLEVTGKAICTLRNAWEKTLNHKIGYFFGTSIRDTDNEASIKVFEIITKQTDYHHYWNELGISLLRDHKYSEAINAFEKAIDRLKSMGYEDFYSDEKYLSPIDMDYEDKDVRLGLYYLLLAYALSQTVQNEKALQTIEKVLEEYGYKSLLFAREIKIHALFSLKRYDDVILQAKDVVSTFGKTEISLLEVYKEYLHALEAKDNLTDYKKVYNKAIKKYPNDFTLYRDAVSFLVKKERIADAIKVYEAMESADIDTGLKGDFAFQNYFLLHLLNRHKKAWEFIQPFVDNMDWYYGKNRPIDRSDEMSSVSIRSTELLSAIREYPIPVPDLNTIKMKMYQQFIEHFPEDYYFRAALAHIFIQENQLDKAIEQLQKGLETTDQWLKLLFLNNLGYVHAIIGDIEKAKEFFSQVDSYARDIFPMPGDEHAPYLVIFWHDGQIITDPKIMPMQPIDFDTALMLNYYALAINEGDLINASYYATEVFLLSDPLRNQYTIFENTKMLGYFIYGCLAYDRKEWNTAVLFWEKALVMAERLQIDQETLNNSYLNKWLEEAKAKQLILSNN